MIDIDTAIKEYKTKANISDGGSDCYDFGDVVLVVYKMSVEYVKDGHRSRDNQEDVMEGINEKVDKGVNTPRQLDMRRTVEDGQDICYVLEEKCKGVNCQSLIKYNPTFEEAVESYNRVFNIPMDHLLKLIKDSSQLFEMGYEAKNKNLFYDTKTGFWFIDFLSNEKDYKFDRNDTTKLFELARYRTPRTTQLVSRLSYDYEPTEEEKARIDLLTHSIKTKFLLALETAFFEYKRYRKFLIYTDTKDYQDYLVNEGIIDSFDVLNNHDYEVFDELYNIVLNDIVKSILEKGNSFWNVECNDIRNQLSLFGLNKAWVHHRDNTLKREDYDDEYYYEMDSDKIIKNKMLRDIVERLQQEPLDDNIEAFINEANQYFEERGSR